MLDKIIPPTNEHDVEIQRIKLEQMKVQLELDKQHQLLIDDITKQLNTYNNVCHNNIIPIDGYFEIDIGETVVKLKRFCYDTE